MAHAADKAARLLKKPGIHPIQQMGRTMSMSSAFTDTASHVGDHGFRAPVRYENTYQTGPKKRFPVSEITEVMKDTFNSYLQSEKYEPELCKSMTKDLSDIVKAKVKELEVPRYKLITMVHLGQLAQQGLCIASRCLWDSEIDTCASYEYRNNSLFAVGTVFGVYQE